MIPTSKLDYVLSVLPLGKGHYKVKIRYHNTELVGKTTSTDLVYKYKSDERGNIAAAKSLRYQVLKQHGLTKTNYEQA